MLRAGALLPQGSTHRRLPRGQPARLCDLSEASVDQLAASEAKLSEASFHAARLRRLALDRCDLSRATFFRTSLSGVDLSTCDIAGLRVSSDLRELRGAVIDPDQAAELMGLLGIKIKEDEWR